MKTYCIRVPWRGAEARRSEKVASWLVALAKQAK